MPNIIFNLHILTSVLAIAHEESMIIIPFYIWGNSKGEHLAQGYIASNWGDLDHNPRQLHCKARGPNYNVLGI